MNKLFLHIVAMLCAMLGMASGVQAQAQASTAGVRILAYAIHHGGNIVYNYKVVNSGTKTVRNFVIGNEFDVEENYSFPQLIRLPLGWTYGERGEIGREIILAPGSTSQPLGWQSKVYGQQEIAWHYLEFNVRRGADGTINDIKPGQTLTGFSVTVPLVDNKLLLPGATGQPVYTGPDQNYIKGSFSASLVSVLDTKRIYEDVWGTIEPIDTTPPTLTVSLSPNKLWPANEKLVPITATITVKDDYDPQPEIQLISFSANEKADKEDVKDVKLGTDDRQFMLRAKREGKNKAGRIYTVTYSATDGSGNKSTASATVTVPHDEREHDDRDRNESKEKEKVKVSETAKKP